MNSMLRIRIRVLIEEAEQIAALLGALGKIGTGSSKAAKGSGDLKAALAAIGKGGAQAVKTAQAAVADLSKVNASSANDIAANWIASYQKQTAELSKEMTKRIALAQKEAAAQKARMDAARNSSVAKDYVGQYAEYSKLLADEQKASARAAAQKAKDDAAELARAQKAAQAKIDAETRAAAAQAAERQKLAQNIAKINQGLRAADEKREAAALADMQKRMGAVSKMWAQIGGIVQRSQNDEVKAAERKAASLRAINANLAAFVQKNAADRAAAEVAAERDAIEKMRKLWQAYKVGQMKDRDMLIGMEAFKNTSPAGSKVNLTAAGYIQKHKDAVEALAAAELKQAKTTDVATTSVQRQDGALNRWHKSIIDVGKNVQWIGRQLEYNFTLPILNAGRSVFQLQVSTDKSVTKLVKVWGDATDAAADLDTKMVMLGVTNGKLAAGANKLDREAFNLGRSMSLLAQIYGVQVDKVADLESQWAATGLTGLDLAKATEATLQTMVAGDIEDQADAFKILNQIMQGYGVTVEALEPILAAVNTAENVTAAQFQDIATVISKTSSVAKEMGVPLEELVGIATVLTPAFGTAATAGNALKTILTRIVAPTDKARSVLQELGLNIDEQAWQSTNATGRLKLLADSYAGLTQEQKINADAAIFGLYQINRASGILEDYTKQQSQAIRVEEMLKAAREGDTTVLMTYRKEIDQYLRSNSVGVQRAKVMFQDLGQQIIGQVLPTILDLASAVLVLVRHFADMDEGTRRFVILGIVAVAALGPIMRIGGAFVQLVGVFGYVGKAIGWIIGLHAGQTAAAQTAATAELEAAAATNAATASASKSGLASLLTNPWFLLAAAIAVALVLIWKFHDQLAPIFERVKKIIVRAFNALPDSVQRALMAVITIVRTAALAVYHWLSYINPFAKHSPSLVDQVVAGVDLIARKYATLSGIGAIFRKAADDLAAFKAAAAGALMAGENAERAKTRESVATNNPEALGALDQLYSSLDALKAGLKDIKAVMDSQQAVVNDLQKRYDDLGDAVDAANAELDKQQEILSGLKDQLDAAKADVDKWANAPIQGMKAFTDAIFENELEQKKLRLAMMDIEDAVGPIDKLRDKMAALQGEVEQLQAMQTGLREAGAGSEITGPIEDQIRALEAQRESYEDQIKPLNDLQDQLDALQRAGERLDLEQAIKFDPLKKQIDDVANAVEEFPFDVIMGGLIDAQKRVMDLTNAYEVQQGKVTDQEKVVKDLEDARKLLGIQLDLEKRKLDEIQSAYDAYEQQIRDIESAIGDLTSAINDAKDAADALGDSALGTGAGDFEEGDVPTDPLANMGGDFDAWLKAKQDELNNLLGGMNPFEKIKQKWDEFRGWWRDNVDFTNLLSEAGRAWDAIDLGSKWETVKNATVTAWDGITDTIQRFINHPVVSRVINTFENIGRTTWNILKSLWETVKTTTERLGEEFGKWGDLIEPVKNVLSGLWEGIKLGAQVAVQVIGMLAVQWSVMTDAFMAVINFLLPVWDIFWEQIMNIVVFVLELIHNTIKFTLAVLTGDWGAAWDAIKGVFVAVWDLIKGTLKTTLDFMDWAWDHIKSAVGAAFDWVWGKIKGVFDDIVGFASGLLQRILDALGDIGGAIWNAVSGGFTWLRDQIGGIVDGIVDFFTKLPDRIRNLLGGIKEAAKDIGRTILDGIGEIFSAGLNFGKDLANSIYGGLANAINAVLGKVESTLNGLKIPIPGLPDVEFPDVHFPRMPVSLHTGGIVPGTRGVQVPAMLQAGEGVLSLRDMAAFERMFRNGVSAAPVAAGSSSTSKTFNFYGDLSFPNIQSGDDAEDFISNLEALAVS